MAAAEGLKTICKESPIPVIADIHFDYKLALAAIEAGVDGLRLNPGNIGGEEKVRAVVEAAKERNIPIRIGVNAGSLPKDLLEKYGHPTAEALVEAAWRHVRILEAMDYRNIKISLKAHDVPLTLEAYRLMAAQCDYPLHVGITEAGTVNSGIIKSAVGIGTLLAEGIGDTIRVSLTGDPVNEVRVAYDILKSLGLREHGPTLISCPTCGRTRISLESWRWRLNAVWRMLKNLLRLPLWAAWSTDPVKHVRLTSVLPAALARDLFSARVKSCVRFPKISL